jgi:hypothetical protein
MPENNPITSSDSPVTSDKETREQKKARLIAEQDQRITSDLGDVEVYFQTLDSDPEIKPLLAKSGTNATVIADGKAKLKVAQAGFTDRQLSMGAEAAANTDASTRHEEEHKAYADFREIVRARLTSPAARQALGVVGTVPKDREKLIAVARGGYEAAKSEPYQSALADSGYDLAGLTERLAALDVFADILSNQQKAAGAATLATQTRNAAMKELRDWMSSQRRVAKVAFRTRPDLKRKLGL